MSDLDEELFTEETIPSAKTKRGGDIFCGATPRSPTASGIAETTKGSAKPAKPKQKRNRSEESHKEMIQRLAKNRIKAYETRIANKKRREEEKAEKEKTVERVEKFIANPEDIFEKKYADKFERLTDMIGSVASDVNEMKEQKRQKALLAKQREAEMKEQAKQQEQEQAKLKETKTNEAHLAQPPKPEQPPKPATDIKQPKQPMRASDIMQQMSYSGTYNKYSKTRKF
jgi:hypothetical protein